MALKRSLPFGLLVSAPETIGSQGGLIIVYPSIVCPQFPKVFSKTTVPIKAKFKVEPPWKRGTKDFATWPRWRLYMVKTFKNLQHQKSDDFWHGTATG